MKKLFELTPEEANKMQAMDATRDGAYYRVELGEKYGFKPETIEFTGGGGAQFFAEKAVKELEPVTLGGDMNPESFTQIQLAKFSYKVADLQKKADEYGALTVDGVDDKEGLKILTRARIELKGDVTGIRKAGKALREFSNSYNKAIISREDELASIIEPVRDRLQARETEIEEEKQRIQEAKDKAEDDRIQVMIDKLAVVGHAVDYGVIKGLSDEQFEGMLIEATTIHTEKLRRDQEEADNLKLQKEKEERERKEESERLEKQRKQQDAENKRIQEQQDQIRADQEKIRLDKEKMEKEKRNLEDQKLSMRKNRLLALGMELSDNFKDLRFRTKDRAESVYVLVGDIEPLTDEAFDKFVTETESFMNSAVKKCQEREIKFQQEQEKRIEKDKQEAIDKALREKSEQEQKAKEEAEEKAAAASDHDKLVSLAEKFEYMFFPTVNSKSGKLIVERAKKEAEAIGCMIRSDMFLGGPEAL